MRLTRRSKVGEALPVKHLNLMHMDTTSENTLTEILEKLAEYEEKEVPTWIPCSERLPDLIPGNDYVYSKTVNMKDKDGRFFCGNYDYKNKAWVEYSAEYPTIEDIIAWQPLPQPYEQK